MTFRSAGYGDGSRREEASGAPTPVAFTTLGAFAELLVMPMLLVECALLGRALD